MHWISVHLNLVKDLALDLKINLMPDHYENFTFLQNKIAGIKIALFKADISDNELPIPNNIISTLKADSNGNIWFYTTCPGNYAGNTILSDFPAHLDFYQKGVAYRLRIEGKASVVEHESILNKIFPGHQKSAGSRILIQLKIHRAEYNEYASILNSSSLKSRVIDFFHELLFSHKNREFKFS